MKYIITESRLNDIIESYLSSELGNLKLVKYKDDLGNILNNSPEPVMGETKSIQTKYEGFEDYFNISDYEKYYK